jgi:hypothetical protein
MITYEIFNRDFDKIQKFVGAFLPDKEKEILKLNISTDVKAVLVEYPYVIT